MQTAHTESKPVAGEWSLCRKVYIETYGCQMNVSDTEVVLSVLADEGYVRTGTAEDADLVLINTCSIRDNAEQRIHGRLDVIRREKKRRPGLLVGVIGCMAERLKEDLLATEPVVDIVAGPDSYRHLPELVAHARSGVKAVDVKLSATETYDDILPVRCDTNGVSAFVSIMRGCNNMCAYCIVPYTRGRERSRSAETILREVRQLLADGYKEVTLLGQNVDSYRWTGPDGQPVTFAKLLEQVALLSPSLRVRFATSHPKDMSDEVLYTMAAHPNICRSIHLPAQSGSTRMLTLMNRHYTREGYLDRIAAIRRILPDAAISTDLIAGFCTETEEDHRETLSLMKTCGFDFAYMFKYSVRPRTHAARHYADDVPDDVKTTRLQEMIGLQNELSEASKKADKGKVFEVLIEGDSKRSDTEWCGRTSQNKMVVFPKRGGRVGDYVQVRITECTSATLLGEMI